ncbi:MAG: DoxX family protein [Acidimicrobiia bacterium]|nr:DoxX family protein [Acidimicrobiia bacterium]
MSDSASAALFIVRVAIGIVFLAHGIKHFRNREKTMRWTASIGFSSPSIQWFFMSFAEIGVGLSLMLGLLTSFGAAGVISLMTVAFWTVHRHAGFWITARPDEGWEYAFVLTAAAWALALLGAGEWSLDHALEIGADLDGTLGAIIAAGGFAAAVGQLILFFRPNRARATS